MEECGLGSGEGGGFVGILGQNIVYYKRRAHSGGKYIGVDWENNWEISRVKKVNYKISICRLCC